MLPIYFKTKDGLIYYKLYKDIIDGDYRYMHVNVCDCVISLDYDNLSSFESDCIRIAEEEFEDATRDMLNCINEIVNTRGESVNETV